jgi:hypothetical protein
MGEDRTHVHRVGRGAVNGQISRPFFAVGQLYSGALYFVFTNLFGCHCNLLGGGPHNKLGKENIVPVYEHTRSRGKRLTYTIEYTDGEYFIERDGQLKKAVQDPLMIGIVPAEATADLMLRMAIADIELLYGMEE